MSSSEVIVLQKCSKCPKKRPLTELKPCPKCLTEFYCSRKCRKADQKKHKRTCTANVLTTAITTDTSLVTTNPLPATTSTTTPTNHPLYIIKPISGKGQGMVAACHIAKGTRILCEAALFEFGRHPTSLHAANTEVTTQVRKLTDKQKEAFFALQNIHGNDPSHALGIALTNAQSLSTTSLKGGVFLEASRINHSCAPNAHDAWNPLLNRLTVHAIRDIKEGEEICISYLDGSAEYASRQLILRSFFGFGCRCSRCSQWSAGREQSDRRLNEIGELYDFIGDLFTMLRMPLACLRAAHMILELYAEEHVADARLSTLYYSAFQIVIAHGDQARGRVFAQRAYEMWVVLEGEDGPGAVKAKQLAENPSLHPLYGSSMDWKESMAKVPRNLDERQFESWLWKKESRMAEDEVGEHFTDFLEVLFQRVLSF